MNELAGHTLGGYYLETEVGRGSMGVVYRGKQLALGREVAVKVLPHALARDTSYVARFTREAKIIAGLNHPNIVHIYDAGRHHNLLYFVMEFVQGPTLANLLYLDGVIPLYFAVEYAAQIADALDAAYKERNVIHRDIKPENLMLDRRGKIKVMDFGLARAPGHQAITVAKTLVGSIYYASPEQIWGDKLDNRSDIYALGVVLYEMVSGHRPFTGRSMPELTKTIVSGTLRPPSELNTEISFELEKIIVTALARDRQHRYSDASILARELRALAIQAPHGQDSLSHRSNQQHSENVAVYLPKRPRAQRPRYLNIEEERTQPLSPEPQKDSSSFGTPLLQAPKSGQEDRAGQVGQVAHIQQSLVEVPTLPILNVQTGKKARALWMTRRRNQSLHSPQDQSYRGIWQHLQRLFKPSIR